MIALFFLKKIDKTELLIIKSQKRNIGAAASPLALVLLSVLSLVQHLALAAVWQRLLLTIRSSRRPSTRKRSARVRSRAWLLRNLLTTALAVQL